MSSRHLSRLFRDELRSDARASTSEFVSVGQAKSLLDEGMSVTEEVAESAGFGTSESLRRAFHLAHLSIPPSSTAGGYSLTMTKETG